jgi:hypothetical protein
LKGGDRSCRGVEFGKGNDRNDKGRVGARRLYAHGVRAGWGVVAATAREWRERGREVGGGRVVGGE